MRLFEDIITALRDYEQNLAGTYSLSQCQTAVTPFWPPGRKANIVLKEDTAYELGSPDQASTSFLVWTPEIEMVRNGLISLIGPDLGEIQGPALPFGKVVILGVTGMDEDNCYERHREIDLLRFDLTLQGYMMRAVSQYMREWSRVSHQALADGFSLKMLGASLSALYMKAPYIQAAEFLFVTASSEAVEKLQQIGEKAQNRIQALNKMAAEFSFDCDSCEYEQVCNEIEGLRSMHRKIHRKASSR